MLSLANYRFLSQSSSGLTPAEVKAVTSLAQLSEPTQEALAQIQRVQEMGGVPQWHDKNKATAHSHGAVRKLAQRWSQRTLRRLGTARATLQGTEFTDHSVRLMSTVNDLEAQALKVGTAAAGSDPASTVSSLKLWASTLRTLPKASKDASPEDKATVGFLEEEAEVAADYVTAQVKHSAEREGRIEDDLEPKLESSLVQQPVSGPKNDKPKEENPGGEDNKADHDEASFVKKAVIGGPDGSAVRHMEHEAASVSKQLAAHPHTKALFKKIENATAEANRRAEASAKQLKESEKAVADSDSPSRQLGAALQQSMVDIYALASQYAGAESMPSHLKYAGC